MRKHPSVRSAPGAQVGTRLGVWALLLSLLTLAVGSGLGASPAQAAVPNPGATTTVVTVKVAGDRTGSDFADISNSPVGAQFGLYATTAATSPVNNTWALCTSDAGGDCSFTVPDTQVGGANNGITFVVKQTAAPAGWFMNPSLRTGSAAGAGSISNYQFTTPAMVPNTTFRSTADFMFRDQTQANEPVVTSSNGIWQQSRNNPSLPIECGIDVALIIDLSSSVSDEIGNLLGAADTFTDALTGTPSRMAVFSFGTNSPAANGSNLPTLLPVTTAAQAQAFKNQYAGWTPSGGTNWDRGLKVVAEAAPHYDVAVMITDGNPSVYNAPVAGPNTNYSRFREMEYAIASANTLKAEGTRIISTAVGSGVTSAPTALNLRAITGPTAYNGSNALAADYYQLATYAEAGDALRQLASGLCEGSVSVVKQIVPSANTGENITGATPAPAGWQFTGTTSTAGVTGLPSTQTTTGDGTGAVQFPLNFNAGVTSAAVTIKEAQQTNYSVVTQGANNAVCTNLRTGAAVSVVNDNSTPGNPGFRVNAPANAGVSCIIYNKLQLSGNLVVSKSSSPASGTSVAPGDFIDYTVRFRNTGGQPVTGVDYTDSLAGVLDDATLVNGPTSSNANLTATTQGSPVDRFRVVGSVPAGADYTVTYRVQVKAVGATFGDGRLDNFVRPTGTNPPATCLPADTLCTTHPVPGNLSMTKSSNPASGTALNPGESATYTLTFRNTGGRSVAVDHDDVLTDVLDDANVTNIVSSNPGNLTASAITGNRISITGNVPGGATYTVTYTVTVPNPVKAGGNGVLNNYLVPDGATPPTSCVAATNLCTTHPIPGNLTMTKSSNPASGTAVNPGQSATYTLTFRNTGGQPQAVNHDDVLTDVLDDANVGAITSSNPALTATLSGNRISIVGNVPGGATYTVTYTVSVPDPVKAGGNGVLNNYLVPDGANPPTSCVAATNLCTTHPIPGEVTVDKAASGFTAPLKPGDDVTYTLTFTQSGGLPAAVDYTDSLADVLDDATLTSGPTVSSPGLTATLTGTAPNQTIRVVGTVAKGTPITVTYTVKVKSSGFGNATLANCASEAAPGTDQDCTSTDVPGRLELSKTSDPVSGTAVLRGDTVDYTLTFRNTGGKPMTVNHTDVLTQLLDDATIESGPTATGGLSVTPSPLGAATSFDITGTLPGGATATVTYSAKVKTTGLGDGVLDNFLVKNGETPPSTCVPTPGQDPTCTTHPVPSSLAVTKTSDPASTTPVVAGQVLTYTLTFANGGGSAAAVDHTDHLAQVLDDADLVAGSLTAQSGLTATLAGNGQSFRVTGSVPGGDTLTVTYQVKVKTDGFGDGQLDNFVRQTGTTPPTTCLPGDLLCTTHPVPAVLSVVKDSDPTDGTEVAPGEVVSYTLTFSNAGGKAVPVDYTDDLTQALDDATIEVQPTIPGAANGLTATAITGGSFTVTGNLAAGKTVLVTYSLRVKSTGFGDGVLTNVVVRTGDTPPPVCVTGDPLCTEHPVAGRLEVVKSSDPADGSTVAPGSDVDYTLTFRNTGGSPVAVDHTDHLAGLLDDATVTSDPVASNPALTVDPAPLGGADQFTVTGVVPAGATYTVTYTATVKTTGFGDGLLTNVVVRTGDTPPTDCVSGDPLCTEHPVEGKLKVIKSSDPVSGTEVAPGEDVSYTLTFENTGGSPVAVDHVDHLAGVLDDADLVSGPDAEAPLSAAVAGDGQSFAVTGLLPAGATATVTYTVTVKDEDFGDGNLFNVVRPDGVNPPTDCAPGDELCTEHPIPGELNVVKDSDPVEGTEVAPGDTVEYSVTFTNTGGSPVAVDHTDYLDRVLDDADLTTPPAFSGPNHGLAITNGAQRFQVSGSLPAEATVTVTYTVTVKTAGFGDGVLLNVVAPGTGTPPTGPCETDDPLCTEHPIAGSLKVSKSSSPPSGTPLLPGAFVTYTLTFTNSGAASVPVDYTDQLGDVLDDAEWVNGPIESDPMLDGTRTGDELTVVGDLPAETIVTVSYIVSVKTADFGNGHLLNVVRPTGETPPTECVASDKLCTEHPIPGDLTVTKDSDPADGTAVLPGSDVDYTVTFANHGGTPAAVNYTDLLADVLDDAELTGGPTSSDDSLVATLAGDGQSFSVVGSVAGGETVTVTYTVTVNEDAFGNGVLGNVVVKTGDTPPPTCQSGDPLCTEHPVPDDLMVTKSSDPASGSQVAPGEEITYTLTFANGGGKTAAVDYTDYLAAVLDDAELTTPPTASDDDLTVTLAGNGQSFTVTGSVPGATSYTVTYQVRVKTSGRGDSILDNFLMEGDQESPANCDPAVTACTTHPVTELTVSKSVDPVSGSVVTPEQVLTYQVSFANTGGVAAPVDYSDLLAGVLDDADLTSDPEFVSGDGFGLVLTPDPFAGSQIDVDGSLAPGRTAVVTYQVTVKKNAADRGDGVLGNFVVQGDEQPPTECVDGDELCTENPVGDYSVVKSSDPVSGTVVKTGQEVTYTLSFNNTGSVAADVGYTDYLAKVLDDAELVSAPSFAGPSGGLSVSAVTDQAFTVTGTQAGRTSVQVVYKVKVKAAADRGDSVLANFLAEPDQPPPAECTDTTPNCTEHPVGELGVSKSVNPASHSVVTAGQELTYRLTFVNRGAVAADVDYTDHLAKVLDDAWITRAPRIVGDPAGLHVSAVHAAEFRVNGELAVGATVIIEYKVEVKPATSRGDSVLENFLVQGDHEPPANCPATMGRRVAVPTVEGTMCTENPVGDHSVTKTSDPAPGTSVRIGDTVRYTLTFTNTGAAKHAVDHTDHLKDVLDDAVLTEAPAVRGAAHGLRVSAVTNQAFTVTGDLAAGMTVKVVYAVKVRDTAHGDHALTNFLVEGDVMPPNKCAETTPNCTEHPVVSEDPRTPNVEDPDNPWLPNTGGPTLALLLCGLLALGGGLLLTRRHRREEQPTEG